MHKTQLISTKMMVVCILAFLNTAFGAVQKNNFLLEEYYHRAEIQKALRISITPSFQMFLVHVITFGEKNPDMNLIFFFQIQVEKYLTQEEREKAEKLAELEIERRLAAMVLKVVSFLLNRPLSLVRLI